MSGTPAGAVDVVGGDDPAEPAVVHDQDGRPPLVRRRSRTVFSSSCGAASVHRDSGVATSRTRSDRCFPGGTAASRLSRTTPLGRPARPSTGSTECRAGEGTSDRKRSTVSQSGPVTTAAHIACPARTPRGRDQICRDQQGRP
ncbi:hypothetical protein AV521_04880 [Streptomyces sp. IMTB 2501]|nr:hypothetical protein AV521_04880 [Streptomyces sp. IMTB 2501]